MEKPSKRVLTLDPYQHGVSFMRSMNCEMT